MLENPSVIFSTRKDFVKTLLKLGIEIVRTVSVLTCFWATKYLRVVVCSDTRQDETMICTLVLTGLIPIIRELMVDKPAIITPQDKDVADWKGLKLDAKAK